VEQARQATAADLPVVTALWAMGVDELARQRGGALLTSSVVGEATAAEHLAAVLRDPDRALVVGTTDDVEVGVASVRCDRAGPEPIGVIEAIYVEPSARQVGVGEAMVDLVIQWCVARGCAGVDAPALPGSRTAKAFFEDHGFVARLLVMHHPIPRPDA
jgi:GNAT superfamily N-acetyltransferase